MIQLASPHLVIGNVEKSDLGVVLSHTFHSILLANGALDATKRNFSNLRTGDGIEWFTIGRNATCPGAKGHANANCQRNVDYCLKNF